MFERIRGSLQRLRQAHPGERKYAGKRMIVVLMGVAGSGKSTIGRALAARTGWPFHEGDAFHPPGNVAKMACGVALSDGDRAPWLAALRRLIDDMLRRGEHGILACSALKQSYRDLLQDGRDGVRFVHLKGDPDLLQRRLQARTGHFMPPALLASQLVTLEEPRQVFSVDVRLPPHRIVDAIVRHFQLPQALAGRG